ncbi:MAG: NAD-dependent epimerase, partial [Acidobacteria bacterium]
MSDQRQSVLLTGGAGFIGSHLAEALLRRGSRLTIVDNLNSFYDYRLKKANLEAIGCAGHHEFYAVDVC